MVNPRTQLWTRIPDLSNLVPGRYLESVSWVEDTVHAIRRRIVSSAIERTSRDAFDRPWADLSEVERHAVMEHIVDEGELGATTELGGLCFRCRLCGTHTVRYVEWAPLQCSACKNTYTWTSLDPTQVVVE